MGVQEEFINHELGLSEQCNAIHKEQVVTELWDNKKHKLIFTFDEKLSSDQIVRTADKKISDYLDAEEHLPPELIKPEEAPQPEPEPQSEAVLKLDTTQVKVNETIKQDNVAEEMVEEPVKESEIKEAVKEEPNQEPVNEEPVKTKRVRKARKAVSQDGVSPQPTEQSQPSQPVKKKRNELMPKSFKML